MTTNMLVVKNINKTYKGQVSHQALKDISGLFVLIVGSGSEFGRLQEFFDVESAVCR